MNDKIKKLLIEALCGFGYQVEDFNEIKSDTFLKQFACKLLQNNIKYDLNDNEAALIDDFIINELA